MLFVNIYHSSTDKTGSEIICGGQQHFRILNYFCKELITPLTNYVTMETRALQKAN